MKEYQFSITNRFTQPISEIVLTNDDYTMIVRFLKLHKGQLSEFDRLIDALIALGEKEITYRKEL